jgi:hypothetical protein
MSGARSWWAPGLVAALIAGGAALGTGAGPSGEPTGLPDLSGLAAMGGGRFVAVHDAKNPDELARPRVSLLRTPTSLDGVSWTPLAVDWPAPLGPSSDLESAARVPGTASVLLVESGEGEADGRRFRRIFHARADGDGVELVETAQWPVAVRNVEGTAVARIGSRLVFIYAERAQGRRSTRIRWSPLRLDPLTFGRFRQVSYRSRAPHGPGARPVSALEVDHANRLYVASAQDPGDDNGPFSSSVWHVGRVERGPDGAPRVRLRPRPREVARLDGLKVESVAAERTPGGVTRLFAGTDDENYGGVLRPLPVR